jgi:POT family proton-dependent oligopeptide transporter
MWTFYVGLGVMILGNGFFKPCISVMVGQLYAPGDQRRDQGFTIFYMGINIGAFMSPLVAGTVAEIYGYQYGFLIAGFGMILGLISFLMFGKHLKGIGDPPVRKMADNSQQTEEEKKVHEQALYEQTRPLVKKDWDRMFVIFILGIFTIAFWVAFEQSGSSLNIFAKQSTDRSVAAIQGALPERFFIKNEDFLEFRGLVERVDQLNERSKREDVVVEHPSFVERLNRFNIFSQRINEEDLSLEEQIARTLEIAARLKSELRTSQDENTQSKIDALKQLIDSRDSVILDVLNSRLDAIATAGDAEIAGMVDAVKRSAEGYAVTDKALAAEKIREELMRTPALASILDRLPILEVGVTTVHEEQRAALLKEIADLVVGEQGRYGEQIQKALLAMEDAERTFRVRLVRDEEQRIVEPLTFPATWYQSVNPLVVVVFAPIFVLLWGILGRLGIEPSTPTKFAIGLLLISIAFLVMIPGAIEAKHSGGRAMMYWLVLCYLFATWGELCLSPIGLSMVTKLAPARYASIAMGFWFLVASVAYIAAGYMASYFGSGEGVNIVFGAEGGLADFFLLMAVIPAVVGFIALAMAPSLKKKMHGIH